MNTDASQNLPPVWVRHIAMLVLGMHVCLVGLSGIQSAGLPETVDGLLSLASPYLQSTRFGFDVDSLAFTTGGADDRAVVLEFATGDFTRNDAAADWQIPDREAYAGLAAADRRQRFYASAVTMAENDLYGLAAQWLSPISDSLPDASAIRLVRPPTLMTTVADDQEPPPYEARLIQNDAMPDSVAWVHVQPARLAAIAGSESASADTPSVTPGAEVFEAPSQPSASGAP